MASTLHQDIITEIIKLRLHDKLSVKTIAKQLRIGVGTVSKYCRGLRENNQIFKNQKLATAAFANKKRVERDIIIAEAIEQWNCVKTRLDILSLLAFYWAEGSKRTKTVSGKFALTNSDPGIIVAASRSLMTLTSNTQYILLRVMPEHDVCECENAWKNLTGIKVVSTSIVKRRSSSKRIWSRFGVATLYINNSRDLWLTIMTWINCWRSELGFHESWQQ